MKTVLTNEQSVTGQLEDPSERGLPCGFATSLPDGERRKMEAVLTNKRWVRKYPELGTGPIATEPCISAEFFELERERVFRPSWLCVGHASEIAAAGDYLVKEIAVCNTSILVMRGQDGAVRGFHNVCSHRGNTSRTEPSGKCRGYITCNFHGWTYDTQGQLRNVPDEVNFFDPTSE